MLTVVVAAAVSDDQAGCAPTAISTARATMRATLRRSVSTISRTRSKRSAMTPP